METETSFGALISRRKALGLLQKELALQVGCSVAGLQKIERDERRPSRAMAERLAEALDVPADERAMFVLVARGERLIERLLPVAEPIQPIADLRLARGRVPLPLSPTPLFGREMELTAISRLLHDPQCRLVTLIGPGGIGKTQLAIELVTRQQGTFADGGAFVSLAPVIGREQIVSTIADALGLVLYSATDRADQLIAALRAKALLLVLDNVEHLLPETARVTLISNLVRDAPGAKLLVTSREPLRLQAEWVFEVQGLALPENAEPDALEASSAARLFLQRARQAQASFILAAEKREAVRRICQLVAGLPLGIELAAAWVATLSCREIADEIQHSMDFLASTARCSSRWSAVSLGVRLWRMPARSWAWSHRRWATILWAATYNVLGTAACAQGAYAEAQQLLHEALALSQALADRYNTASAKSGLGMVHQALGNKPEARRCFEESLAIWREIGEQGGLAQMLNRYGQSLSAQGDRPMARRCFLEALVVARNAEMTPIVLDALLGVAALQAEEGNVEAALEMMVHVLQDPAHTQGVHNHAERLRANLETNLTGEQLGVIRARMQDTIRDALVHELLDAP